MMIVNKAYQYRIYPTDIQKTFFAKTFGCVHFIYNVMLYDKIQHYEDSGLMLRNTPAQYKEEHDFLKEVDSLALANAHERVANQRMDYLHKASTRLIDKNQVINIETLRVKNMLKNHCLAKAISDASWSTFVEMLTYKESWYGRTIHKADAFYASSELCHVCGYQNSEVKNLAVREWTCPDCHTTHDQDYNAAKNLLTIG